MTEMAKERDNGNPLAGTSITNKFEKYPGCAVLGIAGEIAAAYLVLQEEIPHNDRNARFNTGHKILTENQKHIVGFVSNSVVRPDASAGEMPSIADLNRISDRSNSIGNNPVRVQFKDGSEITLGSSGLYLPGHYDLEMFRQAYPEANISITNNPLKE